VAKQRRAKPRPVNSRPPVGSSSQPPRDRASSQSSATQPAPPTVAPRPPIVRASYLEAIALYEQGLSALQAHEYSRASTLLRSVLSSYPEEKELRERVRLYLNVCERQVVPRATAPGTPEERVFAATVAFNAGDYETALDHLREANKAAPDHDLALYMLAAVLALRNEPYEAVPYLLRAIELNPENRAMARHDADLESLRNHELVRAALAAIPSAKAERRRSPRRR
jgi:tetratricopeptide (TPR) repeat protein